jgi:hypothetical protein
MESGDGAWEATGLLFRGEKHEAWGELVLVKRDVLEEERSSPTPNDAGSHAKPNGWPKEPPPPVFHPIPRTVTLEELRMKTILLTGARGYDGMDAGHWAQGAIKREDQPCKPGDPYPHTARE